MRIVYFTESLPPLVDGVSHTLGYLRETLDSENVEYLFISPFLPEGNGWDGRVAHILSVPFPLYTKYRISLPAFHDLRTVLGKFRPDIVHNCSPFLLGLFACRYAAEAGIPIVNSFHTRFVSYMKYYGLGRLESPGWRYLRWFYNRGRLSLVPSQSTIDELRSRGFSNLVLWERGIDLKRFSPAFADRSLKESWSPSGDPVALYAGRLVKEKDIETLLEADRILRRRKTAYRLVFVGEGPMRRQIEKSAPDAILTGHLDGDRLSRAYASADFFVFPSTTESFGNVVLEAAASGLPAIGAREGGVANLIRHGETGFLTAPRNAADLAAGMEALIKDRHLRNSLAAGAMEYAIRKSWKEINRRLIERYEMLVAEPKPDRIEQIGRIASRISGRS
jgi:glycosyltransferase involved in cell wall biosynthesis